MLGTEPSTTPAAASVDGVDVSVDGVDVSVDGVGASVDGVGAPVDMLEARGDPVGACFGVGGRGVERRAARALACCAGVNQIRSRRATLPLLARKGTGPPAIVAKAAVAPLWTGPPPKSSGKRGKPAQADRVARFTDAGVWFSSSSAPRSART
jgi:hypothetical protein